MARGTALLTKADVTFSITGIAGLTEEARRNQWDWFTWDAMYAWNYTGQRFHFNGNRAKIKRNSDVCHFNNDEAVYFWNTTVREDFW